MSRALAVRPAASQLQALVELLLTLTRSMVLPLVRAVLSVAWRQVHIRSQLRMLMAAPRPRESRSLNLLQHFVHRLVSKPMLLAFAFRLGVSCFPVLVVLGSTF